MGFGLFQQLRYNLSLHFTPGLQSVFYTDRSVSLAFGRSINRKVAHFYVIHIIGRKRQVSRQAIQYDELDTSASWDVYSIRLKKSFHKIRYIRINTYVTWIESTGAGSDHSIFCMTLVCECKWTFLPIWRLF